MTPTIEDWRKVALELGEIIMLSYRPVTNELKEGAFVALRRLGDLEFRHLNDQITMIREKADDQAQRFDNALELFLTDEEEE